MGMGWGWKKISRGWGGNGADFHYRVPLYPAAAADDDDDDIDD